MNKKISKYYDQKQASEYEARRNNLVWHAESEVFDKIKNRIASKYHNSMEVLDVGAGTGRIVKSLLNYEPLKVYAIEPSEIGIKKINKDG